MITRLSSDYTSNRVFIYSLIIDFNDSVENIIEQVQKNINKIFNRIEFYDYQPHNYDELKKIIAKCSEYNLKLEIFFKNATLQKQDLELLSKFSTLITYIHIDEYVFKFDDGFYLKKLLNEIKYTLNSVTFNFGEMELKDEHILQLQEFVTHTSFYNLNMISYETNINFLLGALIKSKDFLVNIERLSISETDLDEQAAIYLLYLLNYLKLNYLRVSHSHFETDDALKIFISGLPKNIPQTEICFLTSTKEVLQELNKRNDLTDYDRIYFGGFVTNLLKDGGGEPFTTSVSSELLQLVNKQKNLKSLNLHAYDFDNAETLENFLSKLSTSIEDLDMGFWAARAGKTFPEKGFSQLIALLPRFHNLEKLNISQNSLTDENFDHLAVHLKECKSLTEIDLSLTEISKKSLSVLAKAVKGSNLVEIILDNNIKNLLPIEWGELKKNLDANYNRLSLWQELAFLIKAVKVIDNKNIMASAVFPTMFIIKSLLEDENTPFLLSAQSKKKTLQVEKFWNSRFFRNETHVEEKFQQEVVGQKRKRGGCCIVM